ncbi:MAG: septum formation protein Maf [Gammaproteobacteria bacterium]|nr:septum formation protein Maf [Gammaproteobacteria bacterium]NVK87776.1 septum formation protein Maf [Gammaproteobacteria bacterium]
MNIVLASSSRYRAQLLQQLGIKAQIIAPNIDETPLANESPEVLAQRLANSKARAIAERLSPTVAGSPAIIIGSDQVAWCANQALSKPLSVEKAQTQLQLMSGKVAQFYTAICVMNSATEEQFCTCVVTEVEFRDLTPAQINNYIQRELPLDCAGSFKCEGLGIALFKRITSDDPSALIGLPLIALTTGLETCGYVVLNAQR